MVGLIDAVNDTRFVLKKASNITQKRLVGINKKIVVVDADTVRRLCETAEAFHDESLKKAIEKAEEACSEVEEFNGKVIIDVVTLRTLWECGDTVLRHLEEPL